MSTTVRLWGTRGSVPTPGPETERYGGNTACVEIRGSDGTVLILDAGTGIRRLGESLDPSVSRVDLLLSHLHMDHVQGLGFFGPVFDPSVDVHIYGPASATLTLQERLARYLSPPLFPVYLRDLLTTIQLHEVPCPDFEVGEFRISSRFVCHPNPTVGYRIDNGLSTITYLPDHEPALGLRGKLLEGAWTSGYALAAGTDLLIHDCQYRDDEYVFRPGWGHSTMRHAFGFAELVGAKRLVPFHHDPSHHDEDLDQLISDAVVASQPAFEVSPGTEGAVFTLAGPPSST
jgi:phosphoribosyl 1,2-cyclic phosphodiesterase